MVVGRSATLAVREFFLPPSKRLRLLFAVTIGAAACGFLLLTKKFIPDFYTDSSALWNGARVMLEGRDPYQVIGPAREIQYPYTLHYPLSSVVAFIPLSWLSRSAADLAFVFSSAALLAYGATRENWNRVWLFPSAAFIIGARAGQFSPLIAAGYFLPWAAAVLPVKPSSGLAVMGSWNEKRAWVYAALIALILLGVAFIAQPRWVPEWLSGTIASGEYVSPVMRLGGFVLLLSLLRWREREGRLLFLLSIIPAVASWYEALLPMLVARTKRESQILSLTSSFGYLLLVPLTMMSSTGEISIRTVGNMMIAFAYLPALIVVLRRRNDDQRAASPSR